MYRECTYILITYHLLVGSKPVKTLFERLKNGTGRVIKIE
jgi:hypothetical protein